MLSTLHIENLAVIESADIAFDRGFNVLSGECDDHPKNFSFILREGGGWRLAPAYDLTGSDFPSADPWSSHGGLHQMSVCGKFSNINDDDVLRVADRFGIGTAPAVLARAKEAVTVKLGGEK